MNALNEITSEQLKTVLALCPNANIFRSVECKTSESPEANEFVLLDGNLTIWNPIYNIDFQHKIYRAWAEVLRWRMPIQTDVFELASLANWNDYVFQFIENPDPIAAELKTEALSWWAVLEAIEKSILSIERQRSAREHNLLVIATYLKDKALRTGQEHLLAQYKQSPTNRNAILMLHCAAVRDLETMHATTELNLAGHYADDVLVSRMKYLPNLQKVCLSGTVISGEAFSDAQYFRSMRELDLSFTRADDYTVRCLSDCASLIKLNLTGTPAATQELKLCNVEITK